VDYEPLTARQPERGLLGRLYDVLTSQLMSRREEEFDFLRRIATLRCRAFVLDTPCCSCGSVWAVEPVLVGLEDVAEPIGYVDRVPIRCRQCGFPRSTNATIDALYTSLYRMVATPWPADWAVRQIHSFARVRIETSLGWFSAPFVKFLRMCSARACVHCGAFPCNCPPAATSGATRIRPCSQCNEPIKGHGWPLRGGTVCDDCFNAWCLERAGTTQD
jgi:hypothetical protein